MNIILKYFPSLSAEQQHQMETLGPLYHEWNAKINVVSRKDIDNLYEHHVLHSLAIAKAVTFRPSTTILDIGTGGGFPGIPLAILFPQCHFKLIDGTGKKILVASQIIHAIGITNCQAVQQRAEDERGKYDFVVSRATMTLPLLYRMARKNISRQQHNALPNGIICLKGGDIEAEIQPFRHIAEATPISDFFDEPWFQQKYILYLPV